MLATAPTPIVLTPPLIPPRTDWLPARLRHDLARFAPASELGRVIRASLRYLPVELAEELLERLRACVVMESSLAVVHLHGPRGAHPGRRDDYGIVSRKVVTDAAVAAIVDAFDAGVGFTLNTFNYHGLGTGSTAEAAGNTALVTELTTQYNPDSTRPSGTQSQPSANIYRTVGTVTVDGSATVQEHGVFTAASAGTLLDRSLTGGQALVASDSFQATYSLTLTSGG